MACRPLSLFFRPEQRAAHRLMTRQGTNCDRCTQATERNPLPAETKHQPHQPAEREPHQGRAGGRYKREKIAANNRDSKKLVFCCRGKQTVDRRERFPLHHASTDPRDRLETDSPGGRQSIVHPNQQGPTPLSVSAMRASRTRERVSFRG